MKAANKKLKRDSAKTDFLSRMSHELRTPLNSILGFGQLLEIDAVQFTETQQSNIKDILEAGYHLLGLINEVLDLSKIESGNMEVSLEKVNIDELLQQCVSLIRPQIDARNLTLIDNISNKGFFVHADIVRFKQVLINILSNAVKYNKDDGSISLDCEVIKKQRLRIYVTDAGEGLSEEEIAKLFRPFECLNVKINCEGIGLVITKHLTELMGVPLVLIVHQVRAVLFGWSLICFYGINGK